MNALTFHGHACISIRNDGASLLCDPWLDGEVFNNSWRNMTPIPIESIPDDTRYIWCSHEHPDHFHPPSLARIRQKLEGEVYFLYRRQKNKGVVEVAQRLGYSIVELDGWRPTLIGHGFCITSIPCGHDTAAVIETQREIILNQNDCKLDLPACYQIRRSWPRFDRWLCQFSLAGWYANHDDYDGLTAASKAHIDAWQGYEDVFKPKQSIPFASFVEFCKPRNKYLNQYRVDPDVLDRNSHCSAISFSAPLFYVMHPRNLTAWKEFDRPVEIIPEKPVEPDVLRQLWLEKTRNLSPVTIGVLQPGEEAPSMILTTSESKDPAPDCLLPAEDVHYMLDNPWGADTINICATATVNDLPRWKRFLVSLDERYER